MLSVSWNSVEPMSTSGDSKSTKKEATHAWRPGAACLKLGEALASGGFLFLVQHCLTPDANPGSFTVDHTTVGKMTSMKRSDG